MKNTYFPFLPESWGGDTIFLCEAEVLFLFCLVSNLLLIMLFKPTLLTPNVWVFFSHSPILLSYNTSQFWHPWPGVTIWSHRFRNSVPQDCPHVRCPLQVQAFHTSGQPAINQGLPWPSPGIWWFARMCHRTKGNTSMYWFIVKDMTKDANE